MDRAKHETSGVAFRFDPTAFTAFDRTISLKEWHYPHSYPSKLIRHCKKRGTRCKVLRLVTLSDRYYFIYLIRGACLLFTHQNTAKESQSMQIRWLCCFECSNECLFTYLPQCTLPQCRQSHGLWPAEHTVTHNV